MCTFPDSFFLFYFFLNVIGSKYVLPPVDYRCISENVFDSRIPSAKSSGTNT